MGSAPLKRISLILVALALGAAALAGCGGDDEEADTGRGGEPTTTTTGVSGATAPERTSTQSTGGGSDQTQGGGGGISAPRAPANPETLPEPTEGSKRAAPGVPVSRGGDNSIQTWGTEASAAEREEVTAILQAFYDARAQGEWARACTYLAARAKAEFASFVKGASGNAACAEAMGGLAAQVPDSAFDREARIDYVLSLRTGEGNAFLLYTRPGERKIFANGFAEEGGTWKVVSVGPTVIY